MAQRVDVTVEIPRSAKRMLHHANAPAVCAEDYFKINMCIPFLDHIIDELETRFSGKVKYEFSTIKYVSPSEYLR